MTPTPDLSALTRRDARRKNENNPSLQCAKCGKWKRLNGRNEKGNAVHRFYHCYTRLDGSLGSFVGQTVIDGEGGTHDWCNDCILALPDAKPY